MHFSLTGRSQDLHRHSAHGLAYMHEMLHWAAGARLPVVLACVNRALGAPWNILNDQQDSISQRDTGWIQIYARNNQESLIPSYRLIRLRKRYMCRYGLLRWLRPVSHEMPVEVPSQANVDKFLPRINRTHTGPGQSQKLQPGNACDPELMLRVFCAMDIWS